MSDSERPAAPTDSTPNPELAIMALREQGADRLAPVRFRFIEALARRAQAYGGDTRRILDGKLAKALTECRADLEQARRDAAQKLPRVRKGFPYAADEAEQFCGADNSIGLRQLVESMNRQSAEQAPADLATDALPGPKPRAELKALAYFRDTWSKLSLEQRLAEALAGEPPHAGPLNSHLLVLESLKLMRDISPDYLEHFITYVDALLWLDLANGGGNPADKKSPRSEGEKARKSERGK